MIKIFLKGRYTAKYAEISDGKYNKVKWYDWYYYKGKDSRVSYAYAVIDSKRVKLHRWVMDVTDENVLVDHIDHNGLNCQDENLRLCNKSENGANSRKSITFKDKKLSCEYKGVVKRTRKSGKISYESRIMYQGKNIPLGTYNTAVEAGLVYDMKAKELFGVFALLNFPETIEDKNAVQ
jgi:hypothetical protein